MSKSERVKQWRKRTKDRMVLAMGDKCQCCGYDRCKDALEFHHLDPKEKDFSFGKVRASCVSWDRIINELKKCILLCANCHREIHAGARYLPEIYSSFDEKYADYKQLKAMEEFDLKYDDCPMCGTKKPTSNVTCSLSCAAKVRYGNRWKEIDLASLLPTHSYEAIGRMVGCTGAAVKKKAKKHGLVAQ